MRAATRSRAVLRGAAVAGFLVVAICGCSPADDPLPVSANRPTAATPTTAVPAPTATARTSAPAATTVATTAHTRSSAPAVPVDCSTVAMRVDIAPARRDIATAVQTGTANIYALDFTVANAGDVTCRISGWPGVRFRGDGCEVIEVGVPCPTTVDVATSVVHAKAQPVQVLLAAGAATTFSLKWYELICQAKPAGIDVTLPGHPTPIHLAPIDVCSDAKYMDGSDAGPIELTPLGIRP